MAEQISVSRDTLRAELADMELRIVDRISLFQVDKADKKDLTLLANRVTALERWKYAWPSSAALTVAIAIIAYVAHYH